MPELLIEDFGPNGNVQAVVEEDQGVCIFYLYGTPETGLGTKSVWVRNLAPAPKELDRERMKDGFAPLNPAQYCRHPLGQEPLRKDTLGIVWLPEGNGVALLEGDIVLAIIAPWSGEKGFPGYAKDSVGEGPLAWELTEDNVLLERFAQAQEYWKLWDNDILWKDIQSSLMARIETALGSHSNYYAIDGGKWPPKALIRISTKQGVALVSVGVSARPQPNVEMYTEVPEQYRRIELGAVLPKEWPDEAIKNFASYLSGQSNLPWTRYTWFGSGHTIKCDSWQNRKFTHALILNKHPGLPSFPLGAQFGDEVNLLWFVPITSKEQELAEEQGSDKLVKTLPVNRWLEA